ncbi:DUF1838 domain-containing protein [Nostoc sp. FACHB-145]|uniref:DUF1838 domain-containing protein n=1 Tax=Nostoc sp. FACHB-145 TaxID=2692836 RepID=UPI001686D9BD|nr:DUF1838 domain-containing protein [Nostoc sp. FACHB-145]MBD2468915.1 DUF1838 domain-containing protein [Nostoc sp. FACHB-145]
MRRKTKFLYFWATVVITVLALKPTPGDAQTHSETQTVDIQELVRTRCATDRRNTYLEWSGSVYAFVPQEQQRKLFNIIGMNVARCFQNQQGQWLLTSRELQYYLDPQTNQVLNRWQNPWTGEVVPVVHVANNPVQNNLGKRRFPAFAAGKNLILTLDVPLTYPNVLASDPKFQDYSPEPLYQAGEFFKFVIPKARLKQVPTVLNVSGTWNRIGSWLPWMKMKGKPGQLVYSASIRKLQRFEELSPLLQQEITSRVPVYRTAPTCYLAASSKTSWTYFREYFDNYLAGHQFPIPETKSNQPCQQ